MMVVGYLRVSTIGQAEEGVSLKTQESQIRAWAKFGKAESVKVFSDEAVGGGRTENRPGLRAALEIVGSGDVLVAYSLSRLSRSTKDMLDIADFLRRKGADLVSLTEKIDTTSAAGKMVFRLLAVLGEFERDQVSERTKAALRYKRINGEKTGGDVPFGYSVKKGRLYPLVDEQKTIEKIKLYLARGDSLRKIGRALKEQGIRMKKGGLTWHPSSIRNIIISEDRRICEGEKLVQTKRIVRSITKK